MRIAALDMRACRIGAEEASAGDGPRYELCAKGLRRRIALAVAGVEHGEVRVGTDRPLDAGVLADLRNGLNLVALRCAHRTALEDLERRNQAGEAFLEAVVARVESLPPDVPVPLEGGGNLLHWREKMDGTAEVVERATDGWPALLRAGGVHYLAGWPDDVALDRMLSGLSGP